MIEAQMGERLAVARLNDPTGGFWRIAFYDEVPYELPGACLDFPHTVDHLREAISTIDRLRGQMQERLDALDKERRKENQ
jgi:hypothetical protein